jgi:hypothetical protein
MLQARFPEVQCGAVYFKNQSKLSNELKHGQNSCSNRYLSWGDRQAIHNSTSAARWQNQSLGDKNC